MIQRDGPAFPLRVRKYGRNHDIFDLVRLRAHGIAGLIAGLDPHRPGLIFVDAEYDIGRLRSEFLDIPCDFRNSGGQWPQRPLQ